MIKSYAVVEGGVVNNIIVIKNDESGYLPGAGEALIELDGKGFATIGSKYAMGVFTAPPEPEPTPEALAAFRISMASSEYELATMKITALNEQLEDEDYDGTTEEALRGELSAWINYRQKLRAYVKAGDGSRGLPSSPSL